MMNHLQAVWTFRYFWLSLVKMDLMTRYRKSVLGVAWSLLHPLSMTAIFCSSPEQPSPTWGGWT